MRAGEVMSRCDNCIAYFRENDKQGQCRVDRPQVVFVGMQKTLINGQAMPVTVSFFPSTQADNWCLRYHQKTVM